MNRQIVIYPVHPEQGWQDGKMTVNPISCKQTDKSEPLYFLYYSELVFTSPHYQSIRPKPKDSLHSTNESGINYDLRENTLQSAGEFSNISIPEFESTAIPWAKLEPISNYFKSTDICEDNFTFGILEKNLDLTSNFSINPDHMPASIYKCISEKHFSIQPCHSNPEDHIVALLKDHSKNGTFVNENFLGFDVMSALKNGDIIGVAFFSNDMTKKNFAAFKVSVLNLTIFGSDSDPTLIESSVNSVKKPQRKNTSVDFISDNSVEFISDRIKSNSVNKKRKHPLNRQK